MPFDLAGSVAVVTGATRGIGKQAAIALGRAGASIVLVGRARADSPNPVLPGTLDSVAAELADEGIDARFVQADVTKAEQAQQIVTSTLDWYGRCDVLVNNAAYTSNGPVLEVPPARWDKAMRAQVATPLELVQGFVPGMLERGQGRVINVSSSSAAALAPGLALYSVSKQAMERLNDYLHLELGGRGVSFNVLHIDVLVATEGWQFVHDTQGADVATLGGTVTEVVEPETVGRQIEWLAAQPPEWSGHIITPGAVEALGGPALRAVASDERRA
ncbi:MAG TPA: SDR family oxidoreductase [Acidimicrobiia bacterium]|nr:SDR family oxidoreductase [Acidimicrobiia bacterium]